LKVFVFQLRELHEYLFSVQIKFSFLRLIFDFILIILRVSFK